MTNKQILTAKLIRKKFLTIKVKKIWGQIKKNNKLM
jgi:hypothetical protein